MKPIPVFERQHHEVFAVETIEGKSSQCRRAADVRSHVKRNRIAATVFMIHVQGNVTDERTLVLPNRHASFQLSLIGEITETARAETMLIRAAGVHSAGPPIF